MTASLSKTKGSSGGKITGLKTKFSKVPLLLPSLSTMVLSLGIMERCFSTTLTATALQIAPIFLSRPRTPASRVYFKTRNLKVCLNNTDYDNHSKTSETQVHDLNKILHKILIL